MSDWLDAAAEVGGGILFCCFVVALALLFAYARERWSR